MRFKVKYVVVTHRVCEGWVDTFSDPSAILLRRIIENGRVSRIGDPDEISREIIVDSFSAIADSSPIRKLEKCVAECPACGEDVVVSGKVEQKITCPHCAFEFKTGG